MVYRKFGNEIDHLMEIKKSFVNENDIYVKRQLTIAKLYSKQKRRGNCKNCNSKKFLYLFSKFNNLIKYYLCKNCGHLNGEFEDSKEFCEKLYEINKGGNYAKNYVNEEKESYFKRLKNVYLPKAKYLKKILKKEKIKKFNILDFGCGSGYFVKSLKLTGFKKIEGIDVSDIQTSFGNKINNFKLLKKVESDKIYEYVIKTEANIVSLIGVLEHLNDPIKLLLKIKKNKNIKIIFLSLPLFSLSVFLELIFKNNYNRHLSGAHTHLYTEKSINWLIKKYKFKKISECWFGMDFYDLFRNIEINLKKEKI